MKNFIISIFLLCVFSVHGEWQADVLPGYENQTLALANGDVATMIRKAGTDAQRRAVLYVHGYNDYFFQSQLGDSITAHGYSFYAIDLRNYGRSIREEKKPFNTKNMKEYFEELDKVVDYIGAAGSEEIYLMGHSTGGLLVSYYMAEKKDYGKIKGIILNSPFMDMNLSKFQEKFLVPFVSALPFKKINISQGNSRAYAESLLKRYHGEWTYNTAWKFEVSPSVTSGWISATHKAQKRLRKKDVNITVPVLLMHSHRTINGSEWTPDFNCGDSVLDVKDISKYGKRLGADVTEEIFEGGLHDLILSRKDVRDRVYQSIFQWLSTH